MARLAFPPVLGQALIVKERSAWAWVALVALLHGLCWHALLPAWQGEDEPWHYEFAELVSRGHLPSGGGDVRAEDFERNPQALCEILRRFPTVERAEAAELQRDIAASMDRARWTERVDFAPRIAAPSSYDGYAPGYNAANQPPLAYLLTGAWIAMLGGPTPEARLARARVLSLVWFIGTCIAIYAAARAWLELEASALAAGLSAALLPAHARAAACVTNDTLAVLLGALACLCVARVATSARPRTWFAVLLAVVAAGAATKTTTAIWLLAPAVAGAFMPAAARGARVTWIALGLGASAALGALAFGLWASHHSPALPASLDAAAGRLERGLGGASWLDLGSTLVGRTGWNTRGFPRAVELTLLASILVLAVGFVRTLPWRENRAPALFCAVAVAAQVLLVASRGVGSARYLMPALAPMCVLVALALRGWPGGTRVTTRLWVGALAGYAVLFGVWVLWSGQWLVVSS